MAKEIKTLVVGSTGYQYVTSVPWDTLEETNILDFDFIVVDMTTLDVAELQARGLYDAEAIQHLFARFLASGGLLVIIGDRKHTPPGAHANNWEWCPIIVWTKEEAGDTVNRLENDFGKYLSQLKHWTYYYEHAPTVSTIMAREYGQWADTTRLHLKPFVENRYNGLLAGRVDVRIKQTGSGGFWDKGTVFLLPRIPDLEPRVGVTLVLHDLLGRSQPSPVPDWIGAVPMPLVNELQARIDDIQIELDAKETEKAARIAERDELEQYKKLLYATGFEFEDLVSGCLTKLGGTVTEARYADEEFVLEYSGNDFMVECKGVAKSVSLSHVRQLDGYVLMYEEKEDRQGKGVLFGNAWRELPLDQRDTSEHPVFPENVRRHAETRNIALVSTVQFFEAFCAFLEERVTGDQVLTWITNASGVVTMSGLGAPSTA